MDTTAQEMSTIEKVAASEKLGKRKPFFRKPRVVLGKQESGSKVEANPEVRTEDQSSQGQPQRSKPQRPTPKALSVASSKMQNDPLWIEFEIDDFGGLTPYRGRDRFAVTAEGFISLVERCYQLLTSAYRPFGKFIFMSIFTWYCCQFLYARFCTLRERIVEDLAYTLDNARNRNWNLPDALRPAVTAGGLPTKNLLVGGKAWH